MLSPRQINLYCVKSKPKLYSEDNMGVCFEFESMLHVFMCVCVYGLSISVDGTFGINFDQKNDLREKRLEQI